MANPVDRPMYSVVQFCEAHGLSRAFLYKLWDQGDGPQRSKIGKRTVITAEAAQAWREQLLAQTEAEGGTAA